MMKDSGIEWIGEIPESWGIGKVKNGVSKVGSGKTPLGGVENFADENIISCEVFSTGGY
jgi:type I restriction enzyme S subunit